MKSRAGASARRVGHKRHALLRNTVTTLAIVVLPVLALAAFGYFWWWPRRDQYVGDLLNVEVLARVPYALGGIGLIWLASLLLGHKMTRLPTYSSGWAKSASRVFTSLLALAVALPLVVGGWYAWITRDSLMTVSKDEVSATTPTIAPEAPDPWAGRSRVNIMLLGGDGGVGREGVRTDTVIVLSINVRTGRAVSFSLPRNLRNVPFPAGTELNRLYPNGFSYGTDPGESMLNALYRNVPALHPGVLGKTDNEGADALKLGVSGALGIPVDYYVLVNLRGFREIVDAMGGITVNINRPIPINGDTDRRIPPTGYLTPGPNQHLDGYHALWYSRGRWGLTDYDRMQRQRCALNAIVEQARPGRLLIRYSKLARAAKKIMRTDIPRKLFPALAEVALKMKDHKLRSIVFERTAQFDPNNPDYTYVWRMVRRAIRHPRPSATTSPSPTVSPSISPTPSATPGGEVDPCAYNLITTIPANPY